MSHKKWTYSNDGRFATCQECNTTHEVGKIPDDFNNPRKERCDTCDEKIVNEAHYPPKL
jgi:hypothetical protein